MGRIMMPNTTSVEMKVSTTAGSLDRLKMALAALQAQSRAVMGGWVAGNQSLPVPDRTALKKAQEEMAEYMPECKAIIAVGIRLGKPVTEMTPDFIIGHFGTVKTEHSKDDIVLWPDGVYATLGEIWAGDFTHRSDDYEIIRHDDHARLLELEGGGDSGE
jgi:hypothetical protein